MQQLFASGHIRPSTLLRLTRKLVEIDRPEEAGRVLQFLLKQNPGNQAARAEQIRIGMMTGDTASVIAQAQSMVRNRTLSYDLTRELLAHLASDRQLHIPEAAKLVDQLLENLTPSKKMQLLKAL